MRKSIRWCSASECPDVYQGWNKKWDEWVEETGLQKCTEASTPSCAPAAKRTATKASGNALSDATLKPKKRRVDEVSNANYLVRGFRYASRFL